MELYVKLTELRKKNSISQSDAATKIGVSRQTISKWESGRGYPSIDSLKAIANFFSVTVDELLSPTCVMNIAEAEQKQTKKK